MADNFNMKQFLMENKLGAYSKLKENKETVKTKYGNLDLTQDEDGEWEYSFKGSKGGVGQGMVDGGFSSKESAIKAFEKSAANELDETKEKEEEQFGGVNENVIRDSFLSPEAYERMASLTSLTAQQAMIKAAEVMMNELTAEGFEVEEIREFFHILIANDI